MSLTLTMLGVLPMFPSQAGASSSSSDRQLAESYRQGCAGFSASRGGLGVSPDFLSRHSTYFGLSDHALRSTFLSSPGEGELLAASARQGIHQRDIRQHWRDEYLASVNGAVTRTTPQQGVTHLGHINPEVAAPEASLDLRAEAFYDACNPCRGADRLSLLDRQFEEALFLHDDESNLQPGVTPERVGVAISCPATCQPPSCGSSSTEKLPDELENIVEQHNVLIEKIIQRRRDTALVLANLERERNKRKEKATRRQREYLLRRAEAMSFADEFLPSCEHFERNCKVKFECCEQLYSCHTCHNEDSERSCGNDEIRSIDATLIECNLCHVQQAITEDSKNCSSCHLKLAKYFCFRCKHFARLDKDPFHCDKCGICRFSQDRSYHCDGCGICLDKYLKGKHTCRYVKDEKCGICFGGLFAGAIMLPCCHLLHKDCLKQLISFNQFRCPVCREPLPNCQFG